MCAVTNDTSRKATVRRLVLAGRSRLSAEQRAAAGRAVTERLATLPETDAARTVLGFASFGTELPTDPVMAWVLATGRTLLMPFVDGEKLSAAKVRRVEDLAPGFRGIREPIERVVVDPREADVVLVPGVAFDENGRRLGYGGGFYDAFLAGIARRVPRVGLCFDLQVVDEVPTAESDELVDVIVTPERVIRAQKP